MSAEPHAFQQEELMAYLDGELSGERALALADHLAHCTECSSIAEDFCSLSQQLNAWRVDPSPLVWSSLQAVQVVDVTSLASKGKPAASKFSLRSVVRKINLLPVIQQRWVWGLAGVFAVLVVAISSLVSYMIASHSVTAFYNLHLSPSDLRDVKHYLDLERLIATGRLNVPLGLVAGPIEPTNTETTRDSVPNIGPAPRSVTADTAPMIAKTASLSLTVKDVDAARASLEQVAKKHHGYFADLSTEMQSDGGHSLTASLRVPTGELDPALAALRNLGQVLEEKQGGEEVSQRYVDLKARLLNSRRTETRLTDLLVKRTDKLEDVLDVERELASTREEIERMEAQQRNMKDQVSYASIALKLTEQYKPAFNLAPPATSTRVRNGMVDGYHAAVDSALTLILFLLQNGPTIILWLVILFFPARWTWRKLRTANIPKLVVVL